MKRLVISLLLLCTAASAAAAPSAAALKRLKNEIAALHKEIDSHRGERSDLQQALRKSEVAIGELQKKITANQAERDQLSTRLDQLEQRQQQLTTQKQQQAKAIADELASAYMQGREGKLKMLLNQEDPAALSRMMNYYQSFADARLAKIDQYRQTLEQLAAVRPQVEQQRDALAGNARELDTKRAKLAAERQRRKQALAAIDRTIATKDQKLRALEHNRNHLQKLLDAVTEAVDKIVPAADDLAFAQRRGKMSWPVKGHIVDRYGERRGNGAPRLQGVLIAASPGATVRAIHPGRVVFANWFRGQGLLIIIDHGDGYLSLYAHNRSLLRQTGDWVRAGEAIATVGDSGGQNDTGLYFEIRHRGKPVNPGIWCHG